MMDQDGDREVQELARRFGVEAMRLITSYQFLRRSVTLRSTSTPLGSDGVTDADAAADVDAEITQSLRRAMALSFGITPDDVARLVQSLQSAVDATEKCCDETTR